MKIYYENEKSAGAEPEVLNNVGLMLRTPHDTIRCFCANKMIIDISLDQFLAVVEEKNYSE